MAIPYTKAIRIVANNDEPTITDLETIESMISTFLVAEIYGKKRRQVAQHIRDIRTGQETVMFHKWEEQAKKRQPRRGPSEYMIKKAVKMLQDEFTILDKLKK